MKESKAPSLGRTPAQKFLDKWQGLIYLIPWIIGFIVFKAIPFGQSLYYSFTDMNFFNGIHQYGVMNYVTAFSDAKVTKALVTTFKYAFVTVPLKLIFALFIAYILNFKIACVNLFRTVYYIPSILGGSVAIAVLWKAVFRDDGLRRRQPDPGIVADGEHRCAARLQRYPLHPGRLPVLLLDRGAGHGLDPGPDGLAGARHGRHRLLDRLRPGPVGELQPVPFAHGPLAPAGCGGRAPAHPPLSGSDGF